MEKITTAIIGGGAAGLFVATSLSKEGKTVIFERGERLGRKLSATGNGQGNISNEGISSARYFSISENGISSSVRAALRNYGFAEMQTYFAALGVLLKSDERGRIYPLSRQASSLTDALRRAVASRGVETRLSSNVTELKKTVNGFVIAYEKEGRTERIEAENVVVCTGGKAAKNFGTDGAGFELLKKIGHTVTPLYPSLVQLKTDVTHTKTLKGIRVNDAKLRAFSNRAEICSLEGDVIFTDYGVSGDSVFRLSAFLTDKLDRETEISIDFLPSVSKVELSAFLQNKRETLKDCPPEELLCGIVNNQIARAIYKRSDGTTEALVALLKDFRLTVKGSLGFDYAQVTKGGVPTAETDEFFESKKAKGLFLAGEVLDVDGECGGYNLHFAFASARTVANTINGRRGQV